MLVLLLVCNILAILLFLFFNVITGDSIFIYDVTFQNCSSALTAYRIHDVRYSSFITNFYGIVSHTINGTYHSCIFYNNNYDITSNNSLLSISSSNFNNERYNIEGFFLNATDTDLAVINCNFVGYYGGGVKFSNSRSKFAFCTFANNSGPHSGAITTEEGEFICFNCYFHKLTGTLGGGALYFTNTRAIITNSEFFYNNANNGGAINATLAEITLLNCNFYSNVVYFNGGIINADQSTITMTNCSTSNSNALLNGGAIFVTRTLLFLLNSNFFSNVGVGAAIYVQNSTVFSNQSSVS